MGNIKYAFFQTSDTTLNWKPFELLKSKWTELELNRIYLVRMVCGSDYVALVQKYTSHAHGSAIIMSYQKGNPIYVVLNNNVWAEERQLITNTDLFAKGLGSSNLNEIKSPGIYVQNYSANATTEGGYPVEDAGFLEVMAIENKGFVLQKYNAHSSSAVYKRTYTNSGWNGWKQI